MEAVAKTIPLGFETTNPRTGTRMILLKGNMELGGRGMMLEVHCKDGMPAGILEHLHMNWTETFIILLGSARYKLGDEEKTAGEGETIVIPPRVKHIHPWNDGIGPLVYTQKSDFGELDLDAVYDIVGAFATIHGLMSAGKIGKKGLPKNPLQFGATLRTLVKHGGFDAAVPIGLQRFLAATLGRVGEWCGYRGVYPRFAGREPPGR